MPRHQKSFDEQYLKETYTIKEGYSYVCPEGCRVKHEVQVQRHSRPASYAGDMECRRHREPPRVQPPTHCYVNRVPTTSRELSTQYASSGMLDDIEGAASMDAMKTRSLPAFLRPKQRPLSTEDDLHQLYAKANLSKKYKNRMRSEHAAIIALSKSHSQFLDADAVVVYDQRTAL
ncbi:unnamed protein product [Leptidea sinapis]|uniref:Uncharacterized protein n=1 Tax=Leptidea sinapis TaxID=189913 RepID=A0A5E4QWB1_9NEOP|nr:unnamed protein product [Leptidea sinapis]